jgi:hypothetical protein
LPAGALTCPDCGKTGTDTLTTVQTVTGISFVIMTGLDPEGCEGCRTILNESGNTVVDVTSPGDGTSMIKLAT